MKGNRLVLCLLVLILVVEITACGGTKLEQANKYVAKKDYDQAITLYQQVITEAPETTEAYLKLAAIYQQQNQLALGIEVLEDGLKSVKEQESVGNKLSELYLATFKIAYPGATDIIKSGSANVNPDAQLELIVLHRLQSGLELVVYNPHSNEITYRQENIPLGEVSQWQIEDCTDDGVADIKISITDGTATTADYLISYNEDQYANLLKPKIDLATAIQGRWYQEDFLLDITATQIKAGYVNSEYISMDEYKIVEINSEENSVVVMCRNQQDKLILKNDGAILEYISANGNVSTWHK